MSPQAEINELLHKMTVAETRDVRLALCAQIKRELAQLLASMATAGGKQ
ncbi:hypothetical protein ACU4HD_12095 [Cupriavidus basilensis]